MLENFSIQIISPDKSILKSEATGVTLPSYEGQMEILKDHIPLITFLRPGLITVRKNNEENIFFVEEGTVEFENNNLLVLSSTAINLEKLDKKFIEKTIKDSQEKFNNNVITDKEKYILSHKIETLTKDKNNGYK